MATTLSPHLRRLEAESIAIIREVAAEFSNPVMLYSIGKDSGVMLHLAMKAQIRRGLRRCPARRGEEPCQGADLLLPHGQPCLGSPQPAPRTLVALQHAHPAG
jgi:hypothetical protein